MKKELLLGASRNFKQYSEIHKKTLLDKVPRGQSSEDTRAREVHYENHGLPGEIRALALCLDRLLRVVELSEFGQFMGLEQREIALARSYIEHGAQPPLIEPVRKKLGSIAEELLDTLMNEFTNHSGWKFDGRYITCVRRIGERLEIEFSGSPKDEQQMMLILELERPRANPFMERAQKLELLGELCQELGYAVTFQHGQKVVCYHPDLQKCDDTCVGWFVNQETLNVERCDTCKRFDSDDQAAAHLNWCVQNLERSLKDTESTNEEKTKCSKH
jgi:hypothetical protein